MLIRYVQDMTEAQPGYIDTSLHPAPAPGAEFQFVNVGRWASAEDFAAVIRSPGMRQAAAGLSVYRPHAALYRAVRT
jgi:heme-degrading monooxygenase HmoA